LNLAVAKLFLQRTGIRMEVELAGWNLDRLWGRKKRPTTKPAVAEAAAPAVVQPLPRRREADTSGLPRFKATASDQLSARASDRLAMMRAKVSHAFTPSQPVADRRMFAGREETMKRIIGSIEERRLHIVIYGERGIGKTSLLHMLSQAATEARYIVIYSSCGADSDFDDTFRAAAADIPVLFHSGFAPTTEQVEKGATLADLLPKGPMTPRLFADLCAKLTGTRVLIVLDEFDRCESATFRRDVAELIKNLSDRLGRVQLVLAGVAADLSQLVAHVPSIRRNIFALRVPKMTDAEILKIVANGEREVGFTFEPAASDLVVAVSRGSPYIANLLCHHAGQTALDEGRSTVLTSDLVDAVGQTQADFRGRIGKSIQNQIARIAELGQGDDLDVAARTSLSADGPFTVADVQEHNQVDAKTATDALERLCAAGVLMVNEEDEHERHFEFIEEGLPTYLWVNSADQNLRQGVSKARAARR
jgi:Cdc6-like AAA superfamily ATPase